MRPATKMLMVANNGRGTGQGRDSGRGRESGGKDYGRSEMEMGGGYSAYGAYMNGGSMNYDMEDRYRDYPRNNMDDRYNGGARNGYGYPHNDMDEMESRRRYRRYSNGRFRPRSEMDDDDMDSRMNMHYPMPYPYPPPVYEDGNRGRSYPRQEGGQGMNPIGFAANSGFREIGGEYRQDAEYHRMNEMGHRSSNPMMGGARSNVRKFDKETAEEWTAAMENDDGTKGPHWSMEQTKQVAKQRNIDCDSNEFYTAMNYMYSDFCKVAKKHNVNSVDFYADMAKAFLSDKDAVDNKLALYYEYIVEH